jgi:hypothetical protein
MSFDHKRKAHDSMRFLMNILADDHIPTAVRMAIARASATSLDQWVESRATFPELAIALELRDSKRRLRDLAYAKDCQASLNRPFTADQARELDELTERIRVIRKSIKIPDWYGEIDLKGDRALVEALESKRSKTPLTTDEDAEKARAVARYDAFLHQRRTSPLPTFKEWQERKARITEGEMESSSLEGKTTTKADAKNPKPAVTSSKLLSHADGKS